MLAINLSLRTGNVHSRTFLSVLFVFTAFWMNAQPTFTNVGADVTISCGDPIPAADGVTAVSECEGPVTVDVFIAETGNAASECVVSTAVGPGIDWAVWLPLLDAPSVAWNFVGDQALTFYANGTGRLTGTIQNSVNTTWQMTVDMYFENGRNWDAWSALGRNYKNDLGLAGTNYLDWMYYELKPNFSHFTGIGVLEGSDLSLQHLPTNYYFGFQVGVASNNKNANDGMSGWFSYTGTFNGETVAGNGDVNIDRSCDNEVPACGESEFTYTYRAEDACGAVAFATRTISVIDELSPVFGPLESPLFVPCALADSSYATATDNCSAVVISYTDEIVEPGCPGIITRNYTATDGCGNASSAVQTIYLIDEGEPEFTVFPNDTTLSCDATNDLNPTVEYTSVCFNTTLTQSDVITAGTCLANYTLERTYTITDGCGNSVSQVWTVQVADTQAPVIENVPASADLDCGDEVPAGTPSATDNCSEFTLTSNAVTEDQLCGYITTTTWTALDACGNSSTATQVITFIDSVDPEFSYIPESVTLNCGEEFTLDTAIVNDECSPVTLAWTDEPLYDCAGSYIRIWRAFDGCGNQALESTIVTLVDTQAPVLAGIPDVSEGSCGGSSIAAQVTATDNCDTEVTVEVDEVSVPGNCGSVVTYTWTATDNCGNTTTEERTFELTDNVGPEFPSSIDTVYASCSDDLTSLNIPTPEVTDACSQVTSVDFTDTDVPSPCGSIVIRSYTAADGCGNTSTAQQIIILEDTTPPVFVSAPENVVSACGAVSENGPLPVVQDDCSEVIISFEDEAANGQGCSGTLLRHWIATDACGNVATFDQEIAYTDDTAPVILSQPEDITAGCDQVPVANVEDIVFEDNCSAATATVNDILIPGSCPGGYNVERIYTITDACGNSVSATQTIYVVDEVAPVLLGVPADTAIFCGEELAVVTTTATDNCSNTDDIVLTVEDQLLPTACGTTIQRIYTASDACGNTTSIVQEISFIDNIPPIFISVPGAITIACGDESSLEDAVAIDGCSEVTITEEQFSIGDCGNSFTRVFTATDGCGNWVTAEQLVTVIDETAPSFEGVPQTIVLACSDEVPAADVVAVDACGTVEMTHVDESQTFGCGYQIMREYTATDACGNVSSFVQVIQFVDQDGPVFFNTPENVSLSCGDEIPAVVLPQVTDACSEPAEVTYVEFTESGTCAGSFIVTRTFTATDACGNTSEYVQTISFTDNDAPVFNEFAAVVELSCENASAALATASDECGDVTVTFADTFIDGACGTRVRTYTATDACGNSAQAEQTLIVSDAVAPVFVSFPQSAAVSCDNVVSVEDVTIEFVENCSEVTVTWEEEIIAGDCPNSYTTIRTCTLTDECGNTTNSSYTLTVSDTQGPQIQGVPADLTLDCGEAIPNADVFVIDNCTAQPVFMLSETMESVGCTMVLTRRWTAEDECGNVTQEVQIITYVDETAPVLSSYPENIVLTCGDALPEVPEVTATDNCSGDVEVTFTELVEPGTFCSTYERVWCAVDCSGNETCHTQTIIFEEQQAAPMIAQPEMRTWQASLDRINVLFTAHESGRWGVDAFDMNGRRVSNLFVGELNAGESRRIDVEVSEFVSGIYFIQFSNGQTTVTQRLPIVR